MLDRIACNEMDKIDRAAWGGQKASVVVHAKSESSYTRYQKKGSVVVEGIAIAHRGYRFICSLLIKGGKMVHRYLFLVRLAVTFIT